VSILLICRIFNHQIVALKAMVSGGAVKAASPLEAKKATENGADGNGRMV